MQTATFRQGHAAVLNAAIENFQVVCSWCQTVTKQGNPEMVSHTICDDCSEKMMPRKETKSARLSFDDYVASVVEVIKGKRWHVDSSSRPSSVREVRLHEDGHYSCSCPARVFCIHRKAVIEATAPVELTIAAPEVCCWACETKHPLGCTRFATITDHHAVNATAA